LDTFKARFPKRGDIWLSLSSILFVINVWAIINILRAVPSWVLSRTIWEMIAIISYPLAFALLESVAILAGLVIMAVILPGKFLRENFAAQGSLAGLIATLGMVFAHLYGDTLRVWSFRGFGKYVLILVGIILVTWVLVYFFQGFRKIVDSIAARLTPLSALYLGLDLVAIVIIVVRNI
jgi:hypothetical protein